jgi:hypothetical protein
MTARGCHIRLNLLAPAQKMRAAAGLHANQMHFPIRGEPELLRWREPFAHDYLAALVLTCPMSAGSTFRGRLSFTPGRRGDSPAWKSTSMSKLYLCWAPISIPGEFVRIASSKRSPRRRLTCATVVISCIQTPVRWECPSGACGAGAVRLGSPSGVRGTPGVGKFSHCAGNAGENNAPPNTFRCTVAPKEAL